MTQTQQDSLAEFASMEADEQELFLDAAARGARYLRTIRTRRVSPGEEACASLADFGRELQQDPRSASKVLATLDAIGSPATVANAGGRYFGFVCGGALPAARAANVLAAAWDQNAGLRVLAPAVVELEEIALRWVLDLLGLPGESGGAFVTGATVANFTCLAAARHQLLAVQGWDVEAKGLFGAPPLPVYVSDEAHASVIKSLGMLGLGRDRVYRLPTDAQGRILTAQLPAIQPSSMVCVQAGDVNSGAFDDVASLCAWAHSSGSWVHVDGAFGLWATALPSHAHFAAGVKLADSWATDAHKWLNVPYDCGIALVRDAEALRAAMSMQAAYLKFGDAREPSHWGPELSRRARGIEVWAALRSLGRSGLAEMLGRSCRHARTFADRLRAAGYTVLNDVVLNQVLVSFGVGELTEAVVAALQADGTCWCGLTTWKGTRAMRISVSSWATTEDDVELSVAAMIRIARECAAMRQEQAWA